MKLFLLGGGDVQVLCKRLRKRGIYHMVTFADKGDGVVSAMLTSAVLNHCRFISLSLYLK